MYRALTRILVRSVLIIQLVLGAQAPAHASLPPSQPLNSGGQPCVHHQQAGASQALPDRQRRPARGHDCCHSVQCQCHGAVTVIGVEAARRGRPAAGTATPGYGAVPANLWPPDERLRPPIASA